MRNNDFKIVMWIKYIYFGAIRAIRAFLSNTYDLTFDLWKKTKLFWILSGETPLSFTGISLCYDNMTTLKIFRKTSGQIPAPSFRWPKQAFQAKTRSFLNCNQVDFLPKPNKSISTFLLRHANWISKPKLQHKKKKRKKLKLHHVYGLQEKCTASINSKLTLCLYHLLSSAAAIHLQWI